MEGSPEMRERALALLGRLGERLLPIASRLPERPGAVLIATALNLAVARGETPELEALTGKVLAIRVTDADLQFHFRVGGRGFAACGSTQAPAVVIAAAAADFVRLALRRVDADTLFFSRRLTIEGDTELGLLLKNRLDALDLSWPGEALPRPLELFQALGRAVTREPVAPKVVRAPARQ